MKLTKDSADFLMAIADAMAAAACSLSTHQNYDLFIQAREKLRAKLDELLVKIA